MYGRKTPPYARSPMRRFKRRLPLYMFVLAVLAFALAFAFPQEDPAPTVRTPPVKALSAEDSSPALPLESRGVEPEVPSGPSGGDWALTLVNSWNPLPEGYTFTVKALSNGHSVDERCYPDLQDMMDACRREGLSPLICSSYRSLDKQRELFQNKVDRLVARGFPREGAEAEAAKAVARPGASEHQLGLAVDIVDAANQNLDRSQEDTAVQKWLMEHCWEYGFILRYPEDKSEITGIIYEPWHYRYVGKEAAAEIYEEGVCLEEYLDKASH